MSNHIPFDQLPTRFYLGPGVTEAAAAALWAAGNAGELTMASDPQHESDLLHGVATLSGWFDADLLQGVTTALDSSGDPTWLAVHYVDPSGELAHVYVARTSADSPHHVAVRDAIQQGRS